jgi:hypothetical protein
VREHPRLDPHALGRTRTAIEIARPGGAVGRVFDRVIGLEDGPDGYRAMNEREAIKVQVNL